jgi:methylmalonyl-CoA/ethylmalonyl-CoA epimerase
VNEREGVSEVMLVGAGGGAQVQLIAPVVVGGEGGVAKFLHERGSAIHHIALQVADVEAAAATARSAGMRVLSNKALSGTSGSQVVFLHPKDCHGVLIELVQPAS